LEVEVVGQAHEVLAAIKSQLRPLEERLTLHQYVAAVEQGQIALEKLRLFAGEQYSIITSDLRSVAFLLSRHGNLPSRTYLLTTLQGEAAAHAALLNFAGALGKNEQALQGYEPLPGCQAYTAYVAWLALYGSDAELATAFAVNLPVWGANCGRMSSALRSVYRLNNDAVAFFDLFAQVPQEAGEEVLSGIQEGLDRGVSVHAITRAARLIQAYELMFWDTLFEASTK
jgi:pyrroloquinoline quinone (PQQ) biosynthesis protein C